MSVNNRNRFSDQIPKADTKRDVEPAFALLAAFAEPKATVADLTATDITNLPDGTQLYVLSVASYFLLDKASVLTVDGITVVATNTGVGRWLRV